MNTDKIFSEEILFEQTALAVFAHQAEHNQVYKQYLKALNINIAEIKKTEQIPFLPIAFFKTHKVISSSKCEMPDENGEIVFTSSGTTGSVTSKHYVSDVSLYQKSFSHCFHLFYGDIKEFCLLALLPSYLERQGSSLVYMCNELIKQSGNPVSGFYLDEYKKLHQTIQTLISQNQKFILLGVTYALLDFAETLKSPIDGFNGIVMETGGMKGKREEMLREEIHSRLKKSFGVSQIHSEYGMTELLSQAYSTANGIYHCPQWMKIFIRDINDPFTFVDHNQTGGINIIDLANINSCSFIATQDLGKSYVDGSFEVLGRFDNSDLRGCNLMIE
jgi:phenylacetate-coenzyme A ligase PaaK-like adenylate-forming protein